MLRVPHIDIPGRSISVYGLMAAAGILVSVLYLKIMVRRERWKDLDRELELAVTACIIGTAIGSKLLYLAVEAGNIPDSVRDCGYVAAASAYLTGGFVFYGGLFGCIAALYIYCRRAGIAFSHFLQLMMPVIPLAHAFGRLGCFMTGCCYGAGYRAFFSVTYCDSQFAPNGVPLVPVQLIEAFVELILFIVLYMDSKKGRDGMLMLGKYLLIYGSARFVLEYFRGDEYRGIIGSLSVSQMISIICVCIGTYIIHKTMKGRKTVKIRALAVLICLVMLFSACGKTNDTEEKDETAAAGDKITAEKESEAADNKAAEKEEIDYLILVNREQPLPEGWEDKIRLAYNLNSVGDDVYVEETAYDAYLKLKEALEKEDVHVELDSAFRSVNAQQKIVDEFTEKYGESYATTYASAPGYSEHHTGLALDLYLIVDGVTAYENEDLMKYPEVWEKIHAKLPEYGFVLRYPEGNKIGYPYEPWHIRYVGKDAAKEISEKGITLEEYLENQRNDG